MGRKFIYSLLSIVAVGAVFIVGFRYGIASRQSDLRVGADRIVKTDKGTLVINGALHGWTVSDFGSAGNLNDLVFNKFAAAYDADPKKFHIGHYTTAYGYVENGKGFEPTIIFLTPPAGYRGCNGADECAEAAKKEVVVATVAIPHLDFCPKPPLTYEEAEMKLLDQIAQKVAQTIILHDRASSYQTF